MIDEAHKLRNAYRQSNRLGQAIRWATEGRKKLLLTATPLQNSLLELYGLSTLIDEDLFGDQYAFRAKYMNAGGSIAELRGRLTEFCKRTLRRQVMEYVRYTARYALTQPFYPTDAEQELYDLVTKFLEGEGTYSVPDRQRHLTVLVMRKLLASSSVAIAGTLSTMKSRLEALRKSEADSGSDLLEALLEDEEFEPELLEEWEAESDPQDRELVIQPIKLRKETDEIATLVDRAKAIQTDSKTFALQKALDIGFAKQAEMGAKRKALIFTESRRTQDYLRRFLEDNGHRGKVVSFSGSNAGEDNQAIYERWIAENDDSGRSTGSRAIDMRSALIDHFRDHADIMIATEAAAEGVNLQFCSMVINYDLPWNPQRIEQRIGRCHRYGQTHDVIVINFLNERNAVDMRVHELLRDKFKLFDGVFGASDEVLGAIESGVDFERRILAIYEKCRTEDEIKSAFDALQAELEEQIASRMDETRATLLEHFDEDVHARLKLRLDETKAQLDRISSKFWDVTRHMLDTAAKFDPASLTFDLHQPPAPEIPRGRYHLISKLREDGLETNAYGSFLYLTKRLREQVEAALATGSAANMEAQQRELDETIKALTSAGVDPESAPKVKELRAAIAGAASGASDHENAVFSHLLAFFSRYYDKGDFISQRRYKGDTYAIPYAGEEVVLHWANKDQYYTKSGEAFSNYGFKLPDRRAVRFQLIAADTAKDNRKDNDKDRRFALAEARTVTRIDDEGEPYEEEIVPIAEEDGDLVIRFEYRAFPPKTTQESLVAAAVQAVLSDEAVKASWLDLTTRAPTDKNPQRTVLEKHLTTYTQKNTADYFIHKDLGTFLRRELDFYIKNEVMNLDDVQDAKSFAAIEANLRMIQCLRAIAQDLITFLASIEDFQKKLWLKKKFVVAAHYCVTLDRVPEALYDRIAANPAQWAQWHDLGMRDSAAPGTAADLKAQPYLMVDTALFDAAFRADLLKAIPDLDASMDGLLVHGDNFQGLMLMAQRYREKVKCVYLDPPYNTNVSAIPYKNSYRHSSWASMMSDKFLQIRKMMVDASACFVSIDKTERDSLVGAMDYAFGRENRVAELIWVQNTNDGRAKAFSTNHEYVEVYSKSFAEAEQDYSMFREPKPGYEEVMELSAQLSSSFASPDEAQMAVRKLYRDHMNELRKQIEADGLDWEEEKRNDPWKGVYQYKFCEYRDPEGRFCPFEEARERGAKLWFYRESDWTIMESDQKQSPTTKDPSHPNFRYYQPTHPITGKPCAMPSRGWKGTFKIDPTYPGRNSWESLTADHRIAFGPDETKVPQQKRFLQDVDTNVSKTIIVDYSDGEKETTNLFGRKGVFLAPKHTNFVARFVRMATGKNDVVLDVFGGSGSTAGAVIESNRIDRLARKYLLMEVNSYIDRTIIPRLKKTVYASVWRDGRPKSVDGISHAFKVLKIESYEDTLNNLTLNRGAGQQGLLERMGPGARDEYLMRYTCFEMLTAKPKGWASPLLEISTPTFCCGL